jgi:hypothetical protein
MSLFIAYEILGTVIRCLTDDQRCGTVSKPLEHMPRDIHQVTLHKQTLSLLRQPTRPPLPPLHRPNRPLNNPDATLPSHTLPPSEAPCVYRLIAPEKFPISIEIQKNVSQLFQLLFGPSVGVYIDVCQRVLDAADDSVAGGVVVDAEVHNVRGECAGSDGGDFGGEVRIGDSVGVRGVLCVVGLLHG